MELLERELTEERLEQFLTEMCKRRGIPGAAVSIFADGAVSTATTGIANLNTGLSVTKGTLFQAGSIGKAYTATVVLRLVEEGKIDLHQSIHHYLTDLKFSEGRTGESIRIRDLLAHTAGIDGDKLDENWMCGRGDDCLLKYASSLDDLPFITEPGGLWSYCNSGYILLGRLIEVVTGSTYEEAMKKLLLEPLALKDSFFFAGDMMTHSVAVGHIPQSEGPPVVTPQWELSRVSGPAGGTINTTIDDLLAFGEAHLRGGVSRDGKRVLSERSASMMQEPQAECPEPELLGDKWGLGWFLRTENGPKVIGHDGNTIGQTSALRVIPEKKIVVALLMNLSGQNWAGTELLQTLIDPIAGTVTPPKPQPDPEVSLGDLKRFVGVYEKLGARLHVVDREGLHIGIEASSGDMQVDQKLRPLRAVSTTRFLMPFEEANDEVPVSFADESGLNGFGYIHMGARLYRRTDEVPTA